MVAIVDDEEDDQVYLVVAFVLVGVSPQPNWRLVD